MWNSALVEGRYLTLPVSLKEWEHLRILSKRGSIALPCCGGKGYSRLSPVGTQHFVHDQNHGCIPESEEHLAAKQEIVLACRGLGFEPITEYRGDGWAADVFVRTDKSMFCFEVQWTWQSFSETLVRQATYERSGVRCCWFFARVPGREPVLVEDEACRRLATGLGTPMFQLLKRNSSETERQTFDVELNGKQRPLKSFVKDLVGKRLRYRSGSVVSPVTVTVPTWRVRCSFCSWFVRFACLSKIHARMQCGADIELIHNPLAELLPWAYEPLLRRFVERLEEFNGILQFEMQHHGTTHYSEFSCRRCQKMKVTHKALSSADGYRKEGIYTIQTHVGNAMLGHWCDNDLCAIVHPDETIELQTVPTFSELRWEQVRPNLPRSGLFRRGSPESNFSF